MKLLPVEVKIQNNIEARFKEGDVDASFFEVLHNAAAEINKDLLKINPSLGINEVKEIFISMNSSEHAEKMFDFAGVDSAEVIEAMREAPDSYYKERFEMLLEQMGL